MTNESLPLTQQMIPFNDPYSRIEKGPLILTAPKEPSTPGTFEETLSVLENSETPKRKSCEHIATLEEEK